MTTDTSEFSVLQPGNMSIYEAIELQALFSDALNKYEKVEINLANVVEIDSTGLQLMVALKNDALKIRKNIKFTHHSTEVMGFLDLFNMTTFFGDPTQTQ